MAAFQRLLHLLQAPAADLNPVDLAPVEQVRCLEREPVIIPVCHPEAVIFAYFSDEILACGLVE